MDDKTFMDEVFKRAGLLCFSAGLLLLSGCAHIASNGSDGGLVPAANPAEVLNNSSPDDLSAAPRQVVMTDSGQITVRGVRLKHTRFDIPITINSRVEYWIDYFTTGSGRKLFSKYLERSEFFIPYMAPILKANGMPQDLVYLAMIESGFNNLARSRARAVGPWQFMSATGRRYGLQVNWWVDERRNIEKSTLAAVEYLRDLHQMFGSWELAAAAYNSGEAKIARAIQIFGTKDFWVIARHRFLRAETRDYVPKIIAAAIVAKNRVQFGFPESQLKPHGDEVVAGDGQVVKVIKTDKPQEQLDHDSKSIEAVLEQSDASANAQGSTATVTKTSATTTATTGTTVTTDDANDSANDSDDDSDSVDEAQSSTSQGSVNAAVYTTAADSTGTSSTDGVKVPLAKPVPTPHLTKDGKVNGVELSEFDVQSPADLLKIARASGLSYQTVKSLNPELLRWCTPPTLSTYRIRLPSAVKEKFLETYNHISFPREVHFMSYKVRHGETLSRIARHFGIKVDPMAQLNGISPRAMLRRGVRILLPIPSDRSRSLASLDVRDPPARRHRRRRHHYRRIDYRRRRNARQETADRS